VWFEANLGKIVCKTVSTGKKIKRLDMLECACRPSCDGISIQASWGEKTKILTQKQPEEKGLEVELKWYSCLPSKHEALS
jgi:hypothetical protein